MAGAGGPTAVGGPPYFAVLRHSDRLDTAATAEISPPTAEAEQASASSWHDRDERPWDPPICDRDRPARVARSLHGYGLSVVYSSPFRRCLQTAAIAASELGVRRIRIHPGVGEVMAHVRAEAAAAARGGRRQSADGSTAPLAPSCGRVAEEASGYLLSPEDRAEVVRDASGGSAEVEATFGSGDVPQWDESTAASMQRLARTVASLREEHARRGEGVLVVTHGDALQAAAQVSLVDGPIVYDLDFCALLVFGADQSLACHDGLQLLK